MSQVQQRVAVIGIGAMGAPMARRLLAAGFVLTLCDRDAQALAAFAQAGARIADTPAECAAANVVLVLVATPEQALQVTLGERGLLAGSSATKAPLLALMGTMPAAVAQQIGRELRPLGVRVIDAPISGGAQRAEQGTLAIMTGGDAADVAAASAVFDCFGQQRFHCGALGAGQTMKIVNNIVGISNAVLVGEALRLALEQGLDLAHVGRVLEASSGRNAFTMDAQGPQAGYAAKSSARAVFDSLAAIMRKDLQLAVEMAAGCAGEYPALRSMEAAVSALGDETFEHWRCIGAAAARDDS